MAFPPSLTNFQLSLFSIRIQRGKKVRRRKARVVVAELIISATDSQKGSFSPIVRNAGTQMIDLIRSVCAALKQRSIVFN